jgi:drug/metabolite transporter (DMT)-like permease
MNPQIVATLCVFGLAIGQIFFKFSAISWMQTGSLFTFKTASTLILAMMIYATTSIAWVWVLQKVELGRLYPLMALGFILVPIGSYFVFDERFNTQYFIGGSLIIVGIILAMKA